MTAADQAELPVPLQRQWRLLVNGQLVESMAGERYVTLDPSTGAVLAEVPDAVPADVDRAVAAAEDAAPGWRATTARARARIIAEMGRRLAEHAEEFAALDALDSGNPISAMREDVRSAAELVGMYAGWTNELQGQTMPIDDGALRYTVREPYGVVARIIPFNHPTLFASTKVAPALVAGNTVILKVAPQTPLGALRFGEICQDLFPPGVLSILTSSRLETARAIVRHPRIRRIAFTGSPDAGLAVQREAASVCVKAVSLELGGKNPLIIFPDADVDAAAEAAVVGMNFTVTQGQSCGSTSRVLVHEDIADRVVGIMEERLGQLVVGPAIDERTDMGPLVSEAQLLKSKGHIEQAVVEGATVRFGGKWPRRLDHGSGFFLEPTILADVVPEMRVAQAEVFGPVVSIIKWRDHAEAIEIANRVDYGLTASIWTENISDAISTVGQLEAGYIWVNSVAAHSWGLPFGGYKNSGIGREECPSEIATFTQEKAVTLAVADRSANWPGRV